jgi:NAD-dependent SIR2 family protein deacetylase
VAEYLRELGARPSVVVLVGAGISTAAGISDFRSQGTGLYSNLQKYDLPRPQAMFNLAYFKESPDAFYELARELWPGMCGHRPTLTHHFIALLHRKGLLLRCFTQNIDGLERLAGVPPDRLVTAHGSFDSATCVETLARVPPEEVCDAVFAGPESRLKLQERYGGPVKPDIVFFGESLPQRFYTQRAIDVPRCKVLLVMGTSLSVEPFAELPEEVSSTCLRVLVNRESVGFMKHGRRKGYHISPPMDVGLIGDCDDQVRSLAEKLGWTAELEAAYAAGKT